MSCRFLFLNGQVRGQVGNSLSFDVLGTTIKSAVMVSVQDETDGSLHLRSSDTDQKTTVLVTSVSVNRVVHFS